MSSKPPKNSLTPQDVRDNFACPYGLLEEIKDRLARLQAKVEAQNEANPMRDDVWMTPKQHRAWLRLNADLESCLKVIAVDEAESILRGEA